MADLTYKTFFRYIFISFASVLSFSCIKKETGFPQRHGNTVELRKAAVAPIVHKKYFQQERELFGYNPQYEPNIVTFDPDNVPYVRTPRGTVMTLTNDNWIEYDFKTSVSNALSDWGGAFFTGPFSSEHIVFDNDGDAYMTMKLDPAKTNSRAILLHSKDKCRSWTVYVLPYSHRGAGLEHQDMHNDIAHPPVLSILPGDRLSQKLVLIFPEKTKEGTLLLKKKITVTEHSFSGGPVMHSGGPNHIFTKGPSTFVVWASSKKEGGKAGTAQYIARIDRNTMRITEKKYLAHNGFFDPDNHNLPAITMDSEGIIHVVLGSHHEPFQYMRSLLPRSISAFTKPETVGFEKRKMGEGNYTYVGLVCDAGDNLHVAARWAGLGYKMRLTYLRKKKVCHGKTTATWLSLLKKNTVCGTINLMSTATVSCFSITGITDSITVQKDGVPTQNVTLKKNLNSPVTLTNGRMAGAGVKCKITTPAFLFQQTAGIPGGLP